MMTTKPCEASHDQDVKHLFQAIRKGKAHLTRFMMAASSNTLLNCRDKDGRTPLIECCYIREEVTRMNMLKIVRDAGADVNQKDDSGRTALIHACQQRCNDVVRILIMHCNIIPDIEDEDGNTALIHSASIGNDVAVELLVRNFRRLGLQIDHYNKEGFTALHVAAKSGFLQCAKILAVRGKATLTLKDKVHQMTPMEWCISEGYQKSEVEFLKPLAKFYKVAKLTTTFVKYRKRSAGQESLTSVSSLRVSPIKAVEKVKQKSLGLLKKSKQRVTEASQSGAGPSVVQPAGNDNESLPVKSTSHEKHTPIDAKSEPRGDVGEKAVSGPSPTKKSYSKSTTRKRSGGSFDLSSKQPGSRRRNSGPKATIFQTKSMPLTKSLTDDDKQLSAMQKRLPESKSANVILQSDHKEEESSVTSLDDRNESVSDESTTEANLTDGEESVSTSNSLSDNTIFTHCSTPIYCQGDLDALSSSSTKTSSPRIASYYDSSQREISVTPTYSTSSQSNSFETSFSGRTQTARSSTEESSSPAQGTHAVALSPATESEYIDLNGYNSPMPPFASFRSQNIKPATNTRTFYQDKGRDSSSPQTEIEFIFHDDTRSGERNCDGLSITDLVRDDGKCSDTLEPFITRQFLKIAEPTVSCNQQNTSSKEDIGFLSNVLSEPIPSSGIKLSSRDSVNVKQDAGSYLRDTTDDKVNATPELAQHDEGSVSSSPETILESLDAIDLRDESHMKHYLTYDVMHEGSNITEVITEVDESCEFDLDLHNGSGEQ